MKAHELSISHRAQAHELLITVATTTMAMMTTKVDDKASGASARHFHIVLRNGNNDSNYGNDDNE